MTLDTTRLTSAAVKGLLVLAALSILTISALVMTGVKQPAPPTLKVSDGKILFGQSPIFIRGAMYFQPHAFHQYFWDELDEGMVSDDFAKMRQEGFNAVAIQVSWGSFTSSFNASTNSSTPNRQNEAKLVDLLEEARRNGLIVILWFGISRIPEGVDAKRYGESVDAGGRRHEPFLGYLLRDYPGMAYENTSVWKSFLGFHRRVANLTSPFHNVIFDPLDWQHLDMNTWSWGDPMNLRAWRDFLRRRNPSLDYWNRRWGESCRSWDEVLLPVDSRVMATAARLGGSPYRDAKVLPYTSPKWDDFNQWQEELYIKISQQIIGALRAGNPEAPVGQRLDFWRYGRYRNATWGPPGVDIYFAGDYPASREEADDASKVVERNLKILKEGGHLDKPIVFWETGIDVRRLYGESSPDVREKKRAEFLHRLDEACLQEGLAGWCWWVWRDYYLDEDSKDWGLLRVDGTPKAAAQELERISHKNPG